jgi:hypothetical protein
MRIDRRLLLWGLLVLISLLSLRCQEEGDGAAADQEIASYDTSESQQPVYDEEGAYESIRYEEQEGGSEYSENEYRNQHDDAEQAMLEEQHRRQQAEDEYRFWTHDWPEVRLV